MGVLNYDNVKNKIEEFCEGKVKIEKKIMNEEEIRELLFSIFGNVELNVTVKDFYISELLGDMCLLKYMTVNNENKKETETMVLVKNDCPLFKIESYKQENNEINYVIDSYCTYEQNSHYLMNRINIETLSNDLFKTCAVRILNRASLDIRSYYRKDYTFYINSGKVISFKTDDKMFIDGESNFENMLDVATKLVDKTSARIINHLDNIILEDNVKEYRIRRKNN